MSSPSSSSSPDSLAVYREFFRGLTLDNGEPFRLQPWQERLTGDLLSGVRELHVRVPEENGKTTLVAGWALAHLMSTRRPRAVVGARNKDQANILYNQAVSLVQSCPALARRLVIREGFREIRPAGVKGGVALKVIPADELTAHGAINTLVVIDEMHALPDLGLYRVLSSKLGKRAGGQLVGISTAGEPDSEYEQMWETIRSSAVETSREGDRCWRYVGPHSIAWEWRLEKDDDPEDMAVVALANPAGWITEDTLQVKRELPSWELKHWLQVVCNVPTRDFVLRFLPDAEWDHAVAEPIPPGVPVVVGADWGWSDDATAIVPLWRETMTLGPAVVVEPPRNGTQLNPEVVLDALRTLNERNPIDVIAHDASSFGGGQVMTGLLENALPDALIVPVENKDAAVAPGFFLEQLRDGLRHSGDPVLTRHLKNAIRAPIKDDPERFRLARPKQSRHAPAQRPIREIDAAVAAVFAVWATVAAPAAPDPFVMLI